MRRILTLLLVGILGLGMVMEEANARRFGGGRSFGRSYSRPARSYNNTQQDPSRSQGASPAGQPTRNQFNRGGGNRWLGPLGGLLAGGLIASLLMGGGLGGFQGLRIMDLLMIAGIGGMILLVMRSLRRSPNAPAATQYAGAGGVAMPPPLQGGAYGGGAYGGGAYGGGAYRGGFGPVSDIQDAPVATGGQPGDERPAWFDEEAFVRSAKSTFIRLQAAHDAGDLADIRQYTTPEVFAEVSLQVQERSGDIQHTEVRTLNAELVDVFTDVDQVIASVRFGGLIGEEVGQAAQPLDEIWHFQKPANRPDATWLVSGIQQSQ